jgi:hypothetical protein
MTSASFALNVAGDRHIAEFVYRRLRKGTVEDLWREAWCFAWKR